MYGISHIANYVLYSHLFFMNEIRKCLNTFYKCKEAIQYFSSDTANGYLKSLWIWCVKIRKNAQNLPEAVLSLCETYLTGHTIIHNPRLWRNT